MCGAIGIYFFFSPWYVLPRYEINVNEIASSNDRQNFCPILEMALFSIIPSYIEMDTVDAEISLVSHAPLTSSNRRLSPRRCPCWGTQWWGQGPMTPGPGRNKEASPKTHKKE